MGQLLTSTLPDTVSPPDCSQLPPVPMPSDSTATFQVTNNLGLHMRPAALLARVAMQFVCEISVSRGPTKADAKSVLGLLMLGGQEGERLQLSMSGADAEAAMAALCQCIEGGLGELVPPELDHGKPIAI